MQLATSGQTAAVQSTQTNVNEVKGGFSVPLKWRRTRSCQGAALQAGNAARAAARVFEPSYTGPLRDDGFLPEPAQRTLQARPDVRWKKDEASVARVAAAQAAIAHDG